MDVDEHPGRNGASKRPLLTFLLLSYNQERFIREAVKGAFDQSYSPLEIILSDDCSADRSFEIMSELADSYDGPHGIVLNRNPGNLGIGAHINRAMEMAQGALVVIAAGDDVSLEGRTERSYREWIRTGGGACSIYSDAIMIDPEGRDIGRLFGGKVPSHARTAEEAIARGGIGVAGCTHAFTKECFDLFGPMDGRVVAEDMTIPFRSLLLGSVHYLNEPLVRYRTHGGNVSGLGEPRPTLAMRRREAENHASVYSSWESDIRVALGKGLVSADRARRILEGLSRRRYWIEAEKRYHGSNAVSGLIALIGAALKTGDVVQPAKIMERKWRTRSRNRD